MNTSPINGYNALAESTQDSSVPCDTYLGSEGQPVRRRIINPHARQQLSIYQNNNRMSYGLAKQYLNANSQKVVMDRQYYN